MTSSLASENSYGHHNSTNATGSSNPNKSHTSLTNEKTHLGGYAKKRAQGLCFNCDDKFTLGRKCQGPQLLLLEGSYSANDEDDTNEEAIIEPEISLHALTGWSSSRTMRVMAKIGPYEVVVLIDSGSTHNFISEKVANLLQLPVVPTKPFNVKVANGNPLKCQGRFEHVPVKRV